jgi:hypothetical protein
MPAGSSQHFATQILGKTFNISDDHPVNNFTFIKEVQWW